MFEFYKDKFTRWVILLTSLLRLALLGYVLVFNPLGTTFFTFPDSPNYLYAAHSLLDTGTLLEPHTQAPMTFRTPGYPVFLALIWKAFGQQTTAVIVGQIILSVLLIALCYQAARVFLSQTAARAAAVLCAFSTVYWAYTYAYLSDILFAFLITAFLWAALLHIKTSGTRPLLAASLLLALSVYVRPVAQNVFFISLVLLIIKNYKTGLKKTCQQAVIFILPFLLLTGAWQVRNKIQTGYAGFHSSAAYNLYFWNLDSVAREKGLPAQEGSRLLLQALPKDFYTWPLARQDAWFTQHAREMIAKYWPEKLIRAPYWLAKTLLGGSYTQLSRLILGRPALSEEEFSYQLNKTSALPAKHLQHPADWALFVLCAAQTLLTAALAFIGVWAIIRQKNQRGFLIFMSLYILYFWAISSTFFGAGGRYRAPFESALCILAGAGFCALQSQIKKFRLTK